MKEKNIKSEYMVHIAIGLFFFIIFLLQYSFCVIPKIGGGVALLILPAVIAVSARFGEWVGAAYGFVSGLLIDSISMESVFFATLILTVVGFVCGLLITHLFNRNIPSVIILGIIGCSFFFIAKWLWLVAISSQGGGFYFSHHTLPSIIYSLVFTLPFYFLFKWFAGDYANKKTK